MQVLDLNTAPASSIEEALNYESARAYSLTGAIVLAPKKMKAFLNKQLKEANSNVKLLMDALGYTAECDLSDEDLLAELGL